MKTYPQTRIRKVDFDLLTAMAKSQKSNRPEVLSAALQLYFDQVFLPAAAKLRRP